jgi:hypothetical protein
MWNPFKRKRRNPWMTSREGGITILLYTALEDSDPDRWLAGLGPDEMHKLGAPDRLEQALLDLWVTTEAFTAVARAIKIDPVTRDAILDDLHRHAWGWMLDQRTVIGRTLASSAAADRFPDLLAPRYAEYRQSYAQLGGPASFDLARAVLAHVFPQHLQGLDRDPLVLTSVILHVHHRLIGLTDFLPAELRQVRWS